jgi:hypothetical protein
MIENPQLENGVAVQITACGPQNTAILEFV